MPIKNEKRNCLISERFAGSNSQSYVESLYNRQPFLAQTYAQQDHRIRSIAAKHQGRGYALDSAFSFTQGEFVEIVCWS